MNIDKHIEELKKGRCVPERDMKKIVE